MIGKPKEKTLQNYRLVEKISEDHLGSKSYHKKLLSIKLCIKIIPIIL